MGEDDPKHPANMGMVRCQDCKGHQSVERYGKRVMACIHFAERWSLVADKWRRCERYVKKA